LKTPCSYKEREKEEYFYSEGGVINNFLCLIVIISPPSPRRRGVGGEVTQFFLENETALPHTPLIPLISITNFYKTL
jgi:hypothetical protein